MSDSKETKPKTEPAVAPKATGEPIVAPVNNHRTPIIIAAVTGGVVFIILVIAVGSLAFFAAKSNGHGYSMGVENRRESSPGMRDQSGAGMIPRGEAGMGPRSQGDSSTRVTGVVTAINGNDIVVSGNGTQRTIIKNDQTVIRGTSTTLAVNDSVTITGTTSGTTFTATTVTIRNSTTQ